MSTTQRAALAFSFLSLWMGGLFSGVFLGGAVHLLFLGALLIFPWRALQA